VKSTIPLCLGMALLASAAQAQTYHLTALGDNDSVSAINDLGQIVGTDYIPGSGSSPGTSVAYLWDSGKTTLLGHGIQSANDINNLGQITGALGVGDSTHAYVYGGGVLKDLTPTATSVGNAINNHGVVAGSVYPGSMTAPDYSAATFSNGHITDLHVTTAYRTFSYATGINDKGQVASTGGSVSATGNGFLSANGVNTTILGLGGGTGTMALGINNAGTVVGSSGLSDGLDYPAHATSFSNGVLKDLIPGTAGDYSVANAINDAGQIIGTDVNGSFIYSGGKAHSLSSLLDASGKGWTLDAVVDINNRGQIVGFGTDAKGLSRAFMLAPVPEPGTWATMLAGLALVGSVARRRRKGIRGD
jgi:uncharacterized membrane protein